MQPLETANTLGTPVSTKSLKHVDPEIYSALKHEIERQRNTIELIAAENFVSEAVLAASGSAMTNKYAEGYPGARYYGGCEYVDVAERLAVERAKQIFWTSPTADTSPTEPRKASPASSTKSSATALTRRPRRLTWSRSAGRQRNASRA